MDQPVLFRRRRCHGSGDDMTVGVLLFVGYVAVAVGVAVYAWRTAGPTVDAGLVEDREVEWLDALWELPEFDPEQTT